MSAASFFAQAAPALYPFLGSVGIKRKRKAAKGLLFVDVFEKMLKSANYKVGEVKEAGDDEFKVSVEVQPFTAFSTVSEELDNWVTDTYSNIEYVPSDEELNEAIMKKMYELMDEKMNNPTYGDKITVTVNVKVDKDGAYYIPQKDLTAVDDALFPEDAL